MPILIGGHGSNTGATVGGGVGCIVGIFILAAALLFYLRRRYPQAPSAPSASDGQPGGFNPLTDQVPQSMSGQGTVTSSLPDTSNSVLRQSVCYFVAPAPFMCAHVFFSLSYDAQNPDESAAYPHTKECRRVRRIILFCRLPRRPVGIFTPLPPR